MIFFISPPFGNYLNLPHTTSIRGSFTIEPRDGLFKQVCKTLRYYPFFGGWVNKIGLRNKGIDYALKTHHPNKILSVAIRNNNDIKILSEKIPKDTNLELNISCPNVEKEKCTEGLEQFISKSRKWCIIKLSPHTKKKNIDDYYKKGFRQFHCCNTLPLQDKGGLSGPLIQHYSLSMIKQIKTTYPDTIIIGGGGIRRWEDIEKYKKAGADHISVSTLCFNPFLFFKLYFQYI
tara:strand:- start:238 stop:936 length:699 start_codon:yes stop_codon:yes gene_type:complete